MVRGLLSPQPEERQLASQAAVASLGHITWTKADNLYLYSCVIPAVTAASVNAYILWNEHWEHWAHMPPLEERVEYSYQNIRVSKPYFSSSATMHPISNNSGPLLKYRGCRPRTICGVMVTRRFCKFNYKFDHNFKSSALGFPYK